MHKIHDPPAARVLKRGQINLRMVRVGDEVQNIYGAGDVTALEDGGGVFVKCRRGGGTIKCRTMFNAGLSGAWGVYAAELTAPSGAAPFGTLTLRPTKKAAAPDKAGGVIGWFSSMGLAHPDCCTSPSAPTLTVEASTVDDIPNCWCSDPSNHLGSCMRGQYGERDHALRIIAPDKSAMWHFSLESGAEKKSWLRLLLAVANLRMAFGKFEEARVDGAEQQLLLKRWGAMSSSQKRPYELQAQDECKAADVRAQEREVALEEARRRAKIEASAAAALAMGRRLSSTGALAPRATSGGQRAQGVGGEAAAAPKPESGGEPKPSLEAAAAAQHAATALQRAFVDNLRGRGLAVEAKPTKAKGKPKRMTVKLVEKKAKGEARLCLGIGRKLVPLLEVEAVGVPAAADDAGPGDWLTIRLRGPAAETVMLKLPNAAHRDRAVTGLGALVEAVRAAKSRR